METKRRTGFHVSLGLLAALSLTTPVQGQGNPKDKADFVFVIDRSDSMGPHIGGVAGGLSDRQSPAAHSPDRVHR